MLQTLRFHGVGRLLALTLRTFETHFNLVLRCQLQGSRHRGDPHFGRSRPPQNSGAFARCGSGRIDIIHKQYFAASDFLGTHDFKGPAQILPALVAGQADLRMCRAGSFEQIGGELQPSRGRTNFQPSSGNRLGLMESTLPSLAGTMELAPRAPWTA